MIAPSDYAWEDVWYDVLGGGMPAHARFRVVKAASRGGLLSFSDAVVECECGAQMPAGEHEAHVEGVRAYWARIEPLDSDGRVRR